MNIRVGAIAEVGTFDEQGKFVLNNRGAVVLNCGKIPNIKVKENDTKNKNETHIEKNDLKDSIHNVDNFPLEEYKEKEQDEKTIDGADDMII